MTCRACEGQIDEAAAFCPLCGADLLLGEPWAATLEGEESGVPGLPHDGRLEECSVDELSAFLLSAARDLQEIEAFGAALVLELERIGEAEPDSRAQELRAAFEETIARAEVLAYWFRLPVREVVERFSSEMTRQEFSERHPQLAWAALREYACYVDLHSPAEAHDVYVRRVWHHLARRGRTQVATWAPDDKRFRLTFNALLLEALPGDGAVDMPGMELINSGPDCMEGMLQVTLTPAIWRYWHDTALAPPAHVFVYTQANPLGRPAWDADGPSPALVNVARAEAARLEENHGVEVTWSTLRVAQYPAVSWDFRHPWGMRLLVQRYVRVYTPERVFFLRGYAYAEAPEYVAAVREAIASFEPGAAQTAAAPPPRPEQERA